MKNKYYSILIILLSLSNSSISQRNYVTETEEKNINLFIQFKNYVINTIDKKEDIGDNVHLKFVLLHYLFTNKSLDSSNETTLNENELSTEQLKSVKKELNIFYTYLQQHQKDQLANNLTLSPIRLNNEKFIQNSLTDFQKSNTYILYDKRYPNKILGYVLFVPQLKNIISQPRIWSWTLEFKFGQYIFKSVTGEEGYEYLFNAQK